MRQDLIIKKPIISEKSMQAASLGRFSFIVNPKASKNQIAQAIEKLFSVSVVSISTSNIKGKIKKFGTKRNKTQLSDYKKAIVTLKKGQAIDIFNFEEKK